MVELLVELEPGQGRQADKSSPRTCICARELLYVAGAPLPVAATGTVPPVQVPVRTVPRILNFKESHRTVRTWYLVRFDINQKRKDMICFE
jgi:hypothetical protein